MALKDGLVQQLRNWRNFDAALILLGLAMLWPLLRAPFTQTLFYASPFTIPSPRFPFDCLFVLVGLGAIAFSSKLEEVLSRRAFLFLAATAAVMSLTGTVFVLNLGGTGSQNVIFVSLGAILLAFGVSKLFVLWSLRISAMEPNAAMKCLTLSFLISFSFGAFDYLRDVLRALCYVLPLGASALLMASLWRLERADAAFCDNGAAPSGEGFYARNDAESSGSSAFPVTSSRRGVDMIFSFIVVGLVASAVVRSLWMHETAVYQMKPNLVPTYVISIGLAVSYLIAVAVSKGKSWGLLACLALTMLVLLVGIILCAAVGQNAGLGAVASSHTAFEFIFWSFCALTASRSFAGALRRIGVWLVAEGLTSLLASEGLPRLLGINADTSTELASAIALISMTLIAVSFVGITMLLMKKTIAQFALGQEADRVEGSFAMPMQAAAGVDAEVADGALPGAFDVAHEEGGFDQANTGDYSRWLAAELVGLYGLTEREAQVAANVALGNTVKKTAENLYIAPSTVQGYMKSIYRKMGINRKQSLVDIATDLSDKQRLPLL